MADTFLDMAAESPVPVLSGTHSIMGYVVGLGLQNPKLKILFQSDILLLKY